jgi:hypothetical protein
MKTSKELIDDLRDSGVITETFRTMLLIAILNEKEDLLKGVKEEITKNFNAIKDEI